MPASQFSSKIAFIQYTAGHLVTKASNGEVIDIEDMNAEEAQARIADYAAQGNLAPLDHFPAAINRQYVRSLGFNPHAGINASLNVKNQYGRSLGTLEGHSETVRAELKSLAHHNPLFLLAPDGTQAVNLQMISDISYKPDDKSLTFFDDHQDVICRTDSGSEAAAQAVLKRWNVYRQDRPPEKIEEASPASTLPTVLQKFAVDLVQLARQGKLPPIVGRQDEIERAMDVLHCQGKGNVALIGETGVGKTAIVEGLAQRIARGDVPEAFKGKKIASLMMNNIVAGTMLRGMFEERAASIIQELKDNPDIILFVDELHTLIGAGSAIGAPSDAANIFKSAMASGDVHMIGATTANEYSEYIEKDAALARRMQRIVVNELNWDDSFKSLKSRAAHLSERFKVKFSEEVLTGTMTACDRLDGSSLLDRCIDVLDQTMSHADLQGRVSISLEDVIERIAVMRGKPRDQINRDPAQIYSAVAAALDEEVMGQEKAKRQIMNAFKRSLTGLNDPNKPQGTFVFLGKSGIGKTELAKALNKALGYNFVPLDMTRFMEKNSLTNLIGSPRGYEGHEQKGELTGPVHDHPFSVVFADEYDKVHPDVQHIFMQAADEGTLTDGRGRVANFRNTFLIFAGNFQTTAGEKHLGFSEAGANPDKAKQVASRDLRQFFTPASLGRIDIIEFEDLTQGQLQEIADKFIGERETRIERNLRKHVTITLSEQTRETLARISQSAETGARELDRVIRNKVDNSLADKILAGEIMDGDAVDVDLDSNSPNPGNPNFVLSVRHANGPAAGAPAGMNPA